MDIIINTIKYWSRLQAKRQYNSLINDCLVETDSIYNDGGISWSSWVNILLKLFNENKSYINFSKFICKVKMAFKNVWRYKCTNVRCEDNGTNKSESNLRTYYKFKQQFGLEN